MSDPINDQSIILITTTSVSDQTHAQPASGYTITAITPETPPRISTTQSVSGAPPVDRERYVFSRLPPHLRLAPEDIHIIISTKSGTEQGVAVFNGVLKPLLKTVGLAETSYQVLETQSSDTVRQFAGGRLRLRAREGVAQTVVLLSGDGGVVDVVNGLMSGDGGAAAADTKSSKFVRPTIILLPLGTANALFHSLHRPPPRPAPPVPTPEGGSDLSIALRTLLWGSPHPLPIFRASFSPHARLLSNYGQTALPLPPGNSIYGAIVASYGLHATLVADSDTAEWRQHGAARFGLVARDLLKEPHAYRARLVLRREGGHEAAIERQEHGYILLTLVSSLEKTFTISPASEALDGRLRVVHFGPEKGEEVGRIMGLAYQGGKHVTDERVAYEEVSGMRIDLLEHDVHGDALEGGRWRRVCIDGLIVRVEEGGWMDVSEVPETERAIDIVVARAVSGPPRPDDRAASKP